MNLNRVILIGRLTADPQVRTTPSGQPVSSFSLATNRIWRDKDGQRREETEFHNIVIWGRQAEVARQFLVKGSTALIEGHLRTRSWQDAQGQNRRTTEIICDNLQLGPRPNAAPGAGRQSFSSSASTYPAPAPPPASPFPDDDGSKKADSDNVPTIDLDENREQIKDEDLPF